MASIGHIRDLAKGSISVDPQDNFKPTYEIMCDKKKVVIGLKKAAKNSSEVYIASDGDSVTSLRVSLDDKGSIIKVEIKSTSGVREFDDAAVESFNKAGPFPNPPSGMIKNGLAVVEWGFVVKS